MLNRPAEMWSFVARINLLHMEILPPSKHLNQSFGHLHRSCPVQVSIDIMVFNVHIYTYIVDCSTQHTMNLYEKFSLNWHKHFSSNICYRTSRTSTFAGITSVQPNSHDQL